MATALLEVLKLKPLAALKTAPGGAAPATSRAPAGGSGSKAAPAGQAPAAPPPAAATSADDERARNNAKRLIAALSKGYEESIVRGHAAVNAQPVDTLKKSLGADISRVAT
jgi:hypothetical protein